MAIKPISLIAGILGIYAGIYCFKYKSGRVNLDSESEDRRKKQVKKHSAIITLVGCVSILLGSLLIIGSF